MSPLVVQGGEHLKTVRAFESLWMIMTLADRLTQRCNLLRVVPRSDSFQHTANLAALLAWPLDGLHLTVLHMNFKELCS